MKRLDLFILYRALQALFVVYLLLSNSYLTEDIIDVAVWCSPLTAGVFIVNFTKYVKFRKYKVRATFGFGLLLFFLIAAECVLLGLGAVGHITTQDALRGIIAIEALMVIQLAIVKEIKNL